MLEGLSMRAPAATLVVALLLLTSTRGAQPVPAADGIRPRLVVFLSVDQFRRDYVERYGPRWTSGLARLVREGAYFDHAAYPYFHTITCPGHATMSTGTYPATHGLPLNAWWDRETGKEVQCTSDAESPQIGHRPGAEKEPAGGHSAKWLRVPAFADVLRQEVKPTPRIVSLSIKPRAAIMLGGHGGDVVLWYTPEGGATTSTAYAGRAIPWVGKFASMNPTREELSGEWNRLLPPGAYLQEDDGPGEHPPEGWTNLFPHPLTQGHPDGRIRSYWQQTPNADIYLARLAKRAVEELKLGRQGTLDYLAISFSTLDSVGHGFGPDSHEVQDVLLRLDRTLGEFLSFLDDKVGKGQYVVSVTGDHGVAPLPERRKSQGEDGGRINLKAMAVEIDAALAARWGRGTYVSRVVYTDIYFAKGVYARLEADPAAMAEVTAIVEKTPGVAKVFRKDQILGAAAAGDPAELTALRLSYVPDRSGDMIQVPKPYWISILADGTTHGTPQPYDREVPVVLYGAGVKPGRYTGPASPADIAPTLGAIVGVKMPKVDGRVLNDALLQPVAASSTAQR
jgi:predicted AlkP superfamily pyrophosphatase or phosphodiesterase